MKKTRAPRTTAAAPPKPPAPPVPDASSLLSADELRAATTWDLWVTPTKRILCRILGVADVLLMGIVPLHLQSALREGTDDAVRGEDGISIKPEFRGVIEDYAVAAALHPKLFNGRDADGRPLPIPPSAIGTWEIPDGLLLQLFNGGMSQIAQVDPARVETFRRAAVAAADEPALSGESVRPGPAPVADAAGPRGTEWTG